MTPSDTTIDYMVSSLLPLHSDLWYNSLGSTCTCHYLIVGTNVKLNFRFVGRPIVNHCEGHNSVIRSAIEVHELLMEILFDNLSNRSGPTSISRRQGLQIIKTFCRCFCRKLHHRHELVVHPWDPGPSWSTPKGGGRHTKESLGRPPPWPPPYETSKGVQVKLEAQSVSGSSPFRTPGIACTKTDAQVAY